MTLIKILPSFERSAKKLTMQEKTRLAGSLEKFNAFLVAGQTSGGLNFKKINHDKYEFRVDDRLRVVIKKEADIYYLVLVGDHARIRQYLRNFRSK